MNGRHTIKSLREYVANPPMEEGGYEETMDSYEVAKYLYQAGLTLQQAKALVKEVHGHSNIGVWWDGLERDYPKRQAETPEEFDAADFADLPDTPPSWIVKQWIPDNQITILSGDGGAGKSTMAMQLACAVALGFPWLDLKTEQGTVIYVGAEDSIKDVRPTFAAVLAGPYGFTGATFADLTGRLKIWDLSQADELYLATYENGRLQPTENFGTLKAMVRRLRPRLIVLDTLVDVFDGDENSRRQCKAFMKLLKTLGCAVLLLAHTSLRGKTTGQGTSGSTGWRNAARSMATVTWAGKLERQLEPRKTQRGPEPDDLNLKWCDVGPNGGVYERAPGKPAKTRAQASEALPDTDRAELVAADFLDRLKASAAPLSPNPKAPANYAPRVFAHGSKAFNESDYAVAMFNLLSAAAIESRDYLTPQRKKRQRLFIVGQ